MTYPKIPLTDASLSIRKGKMARSYLYEGDHASPTCNVLLFGFGVLGGA